MIFLTFLADIALRSSLILGGVLMLLSLMKRASASERHFALLLGLILVGLLPVGLLVSPKVIWLVPLPPHEKLSVVVPSHALLPSNADLTTPVAPIPALAGKVAWPAVDVTMVTIVLLGIGAVTQVVVFAQAAGVWRRIRREAMPVDLPDSTLRVVRSFAGAKGLPGILVSDRIQVPVLAGWLRPAILLPRHLAEGAGEKLIMVLCHELAHFRRGDSRLLPLLAFLRAVYWWHPLVWLAIARLRCEREGACDDLVLAHGLRPTDYASLIVSVARDMKRTATMPMGAMAMASSSQVTERVISILNPSTRRRQPGRASLFLGILAAGMVGYGVAATQIEAADESGASPGKDAAPSGKAQIELQYKLVLVDEKTYEGQKAVIDAAVSRTDLDFFVHLPGASFLSTPTVVTLDGLMASVDILREVSYPIAYEKGKDGKMAPSEFKTREIGLSIHATPHLQADQRTVGLHFKCELTDFAGWIDYPSGIRQPLFNTRRIEQNEALIGTRGIAVWVGSSAIQNQPFDPTLPASDWTQRNDKTPKRALIFITPRVLPPEPKPVALTPEQQKLMIRVEIKYFQISEKTYAEQPVAIDTALQRGDMKFLSGLPGFCLLTEPSVLTRMGEQAVLEANPDIPLPARFSSPGGTKSRRMGVRTVIKSGFATDGNIALQLFPEITTYTGSVKMGAGVEEPAFNTRRANINIGLSDGQTRGVWAEIHSTDLSKIEAWTSEKPTNVFTLDTTPMRVGMVVTADLFVRDGMKLRDGRP